MRLLLLTLLTTGASVLVAGAPTHAGDFDLVFDVVFLVDVSQSAATIYTDVSYLSPNEYFGRVAIIPVQGNKHPITIATASLNTIVSMNYLGDYLDSTFEYFSDFEDYGQSLQADLDVATAPSFLSEGYRTNQTNHLIIYIPSNAYFASNPSTASILRNDTYGIITIGYGPGIIKWDSIAFQALSGGVDCYFPATTVNDLIEKVLPKVQAMISKADANGGIYCGNKPAN